MKIDKKAINYYFSFFEVSKELNQKQFYDFNMAIYKVMFSKGSNFENTKNVIFKDEHLNDVWDGIVIQLSKRDRNSYDYTHWRTSVFERDLYSCQVCKNSIGKLNAHHVVRWIDSVEKRFELSNGITLCIPCHQKVHRGEIKL